MSLPGATSSPFTSPFVLRELSFHVSRGQTWTGPEQRAADPNHRRTFSHGELEVVAHAHRQLGQRQPLGQRPHRSEAGASRIVVACRGDRHQTPHVEVEVAEPVDQAGDEAGLRAAPDRVVGQVDLDEHPGAGGVASDLLPEPQAIDGLPECDEMGDLADLVALELADEVPPGVGREPAAFAVSSCA